MMLAADPRFTSRIGGPLGSHAIRRGIWFNTGSWALLVGTLTWLLLLMRQLPCRNLRPGAETDVYVPMCYSDLPLQYTNGVDAFPGGIWLSAKSNRWLATHLPLVPSGLPDAEEKLMSTDAVFALAAGVLGLVFLLFLVAVNRWFRPDSGAVWLAAMPVFATAGVINWDVFALAAGAGALLAWRRGHWLIGGLATGFALGFGWYPILLLVLFAWSAVTYRRPFALVLVVVGTVTGGAAINLPSILAGPEAWWRSVVDLVAAPAGLGSPWWILSDIGLKLPGQVVVSAIFMVFGGYLVLWWLRGLPTPPKAGVVLFSITAATFILAPGWSPQMSMWLILALVLAAPTLRQILLVSGVELAYFLAVWTHLRGGFAPSNAPVDPLYWVAIIARLVVVAWVAVQVLRRARQRSFAFPPPGLGTTSVPALVPVAFSLGSGSNSLRPGRVAGSGSNVEPHARLSADSGAVSQDPSLPATLGTPVEFAATSESGIGQDEKAHRFGFCAESDSETQGLTQSLGGGLPATSPTTPPADPKPRRVWLSDDDKLVLRLWLVSRLLLAIVLVTVMLATKRAFVQVFGNWDVEHFAAIAQNGYADPNDVAFFPGLPLLMKLGTLIGIPPVVGGVLLSLIGSGLAALAIYRLGGIWATVAWLVAPTAVFTFVGYTEALFCAAAFWAWYWLRNERMLFASIAVAAACTLRVSGLFLIGAVAVAIIVARRWRHLTALIPGVLVLASYASYLFVKTGSWTAWYQAQADGWKRTFTWPWQSLLNTLPATKYGAWMEDSWSWVFRFEIASMVVGVIVVAYWLIRRKLPEASWVGVQVLAFSISYWFMSVTRAILLWFPAFMMFAAFAASRPKNPRLALATRALAYAWLLVSTALMIWWATQYGRGQWAS